MRSLISAFVISLLLAGSNPAQAEGAGDYEAVRHEAVEFITGWREGDAKLIDSAADLENGSAIWARTVEGKSTVVSMTFAKMIEGLMPHPEYAVPYKILSVSIAGDELAYVNIAAQRGAGGTILDYFTLLKVVEKWEVIALHWLWRPGMQVASD